jgi:hypothetical protein
MKAKAWFLVLGSLLVVGLLHPSSAVRTASADNTAPNINLSLNLALMNALPAPADDPLLDANGNPVLDANGNQVSDPSEAFHKVIPTVFDPFNTHLAQSTWLDGIGCPTGAKTEVFLPPTFSTHGPGTYTDPACNTGDPKDNHNEGLLMVKTGPTNDDVAAVAELKKVRGSTVQELGYDIRKKGGSASITGSHCGAGAPRFNVQTSDGLWFVGCNSPAATTETLGDGYTRLRWGPGVVLGYKDGVALSPITGTVQRVTIVFDEGYDTGGDFFGAAILDNIDYNKTLVGRGPVGKGMQESNDDDDDD